MVLKPAEEHSLTAERNPRTPTPRCAAMRLSTTVSRKSQLSVQDVENASAWRYTVSPGYNGSAKAGHFVRYSKGPVYNKISQRQERITYENIALKKEKKGKMFHSTEPEPGQYHW